MPERRLVVPMRPGAARRQPAVLGHRQRNRGRLVHYSGAGLLGIAGLRQAVLFCLRLPGVIGTEEGRIPDIDETQVYVGQYRRTFSAPEVPAGGRAVLCFGGVKSAFRCWVNGAYAGFGKGSMLPVEFDVTSLLHPGGEHAGRGGAGVF